MNWQPIETAPKKAARVALLWMGDAPRIGYWSDRYGLWVTEDGDYSWSGSNPPTHWCEIVPPAPSTATGDGLGEIITKGDDRD